MPCSSMSIDRWVLENENIRPDLARFRGIYGHCATDKWSKFVMMHPWFEIPSNVQVPRTFARDELDVVYVDHMVRFVNLAAGTGVSLHRNDIPLFYLRDSLLGRRWNRFSEAARLLEAISIWHSSGFMVAAEDLLFTYNENSGLHCPAWDWWDISYFPAGILTPIPPCVYYFCDRILAATGKAAEFWDYVAQLEYAQLFAACWWHEAERGQRGYMIPEETIVWLEQKLGSDYVVDVEASNGRDPNCTKLSWVLARMQEVREAPRRSWHTVAFPNTQPPPSTFVRVQRGTVHLSDQVDHGLPWTRDLRTGRLQVDLDELRRTCDRRLQYFTGPSVTLRDLQWQGVIRMNRKRPPQGEYVRPAQHRRIASSPPTVHLPPVRESVPTRTQFRSESAPPVMHGHHARVSETRPSSQPEFQLPVVHVEPPPPRTRMTDNLNFAQQIVHTHLMQPTHRENHKQLVQSRQQTHRPIRGDRIHNPADDYKIRPFCDWDDEVLRRWIVQWEVRKGNGVPNPRQINAIQNELVNKRCTAMDLWMFK